MSFTVFLGNLPSWVTADDIKQWLAAEDLVADAVKVIRNHETQESKGFAFVEAPTADEMASIIRRFDRAPLEDRLLRANPAQPPKGKESRGAQPIQRPMPVPPALSGPTAENAAAATGNRRLAAHSQPSWRRFFNPPGRLGGRCAASAHPTPVTSSHKRCFFIPLVFISYSWRLKCFLARHEIRLAQPAARGRADGLG